MDIRHAVGVKAGELSLDSETVHVEVVLAATQRGSG